jgi:hypothetical protein
VFAVLERRAEESGRPSGGTSSTAPGAGKPLPGENGLAWVGSQLRRATRIPKNAGWVPEDVSGRREIGDRRHLLALGEADSPERYAGQARLRLLLERLGDLRGGDLALPNRHLRQISERPGERRRG